MTTAAFLRRRPVRSDYRPSPRDRLHATAKRRARTEMTCATCGHELRPDARYCPRCGTPANATPPPAHWQAPPGPQGGPGVVGPVPLQAQPPAQGAPPLYPPAQYPPAQYPPAQPAPQFGPPAGVPSGVSRFGPAPVYPQAAPPAGFPMGPPPQPPAWPMGAPPPQHVPPPVPPGAAAVGRAFPDDTQVRRGPVPPSEEHTFVAPRPGPDFWIGGCGVKNLRRAATKPARRSGPAP